LWWWEADCKYRPNQHQNESKKKKTRARIQGTGIATIQQIAKDYDVHPVQVSEWKKIMLEGAGDVFGTGAARGKSAAEIFEKERDGLHAKIGQLAVEVDFLRKKSKQLGL
jgi:transposase